MTNKSIKGSQSNMNIKKIASSNIPVWYYYYGTRVDGRIISASISEITENRKKSYEVQIDGINSNFMTKRNAMALYERSVSELIEKHA